MYTVSAVNYMDISALGCGKEFIAALHTRKCESMTEAERTAKEFESLGYAEIQINEPFW